MALMNEADREGLARIARESAARQDPRQVIVANLRSYCLEHGIDPSDSELFVIAEDSIARQLKPASSPAEQDKPVLAPRGLKDRRSREQRQGPRRTADRRRTGLPALVEKVRRLGQPERRSGSDRRSDSDRREVIRRRHVRRKDER